MNGNTAHEQSPSVPAKSAGRNPLRPSGFTLIELLVVISIIALLAGILFPSISKARAFGKSAACKGNLHAAGAAFQMYVNDSHDVMPNAAAGALTNEYNDSDDPNDPDDPDDPEKPLLIDVLGPSLSAPEVLLCPDDTNREYFTKEGSSYVYNMLLYNEGKQYTDNPIIQMVGVESMWVLNEFNKNAHADAGGKNILYLDWHVEE